MRLKHSWSYDGGTDPNLLRRLASNLSLYVRKQQYNIFLKIVRPTPKDEIIDVGVSPDENLKDTNFFEKKYPYKNKLSIASIEDCKSIVNKYKLRQYIQIRPGKRLPLKDKSYDIVVSWATIEHAGNDSNQKFYMKELCRIGKRVFITTPDRLSIYEPHTTTFFLHYLPPKYFRKILKFMGKDFWAEEKNLNILSYEDIAKILPDTNTKVIKYKIFHLLPSHLIIYRKA